VLLVGCEGVSIRDVRFRDSANYAVFVEQTNDLEMRDVRVTGGWDGFHFRGGPKAPCRALRLEGCTFSTGDDAIAGRYAEDLTIRDCAIDSSCNGIRVIGPVRRMLVQGCVFEGPGRAEHRSSGRTNMLAGILLQPGAWDATEGELADVLISDVTMRGVAAPVQVVVNEGNTAGGIVVERLSATGVYRAPISVEGWARLPVGRVVLRDVDVEYAGGGTAEDAALRVDRSALDPRPLPAWGLFARNVADLVVEDVRLGLVEPDARPAARLEGVVRVRVDGLRLPPGVTARESLVLEGSGTVEGSP
jgi:hypothetical protein